MKKSLYIFLTAVLGVMLFLVLDRIVVFSYLYLIGGGYVSANFDYAQFVVWDYFTLTLVLILGAWYGVWLGLSWYAQIYEYKTHGGLVEHLAQNYWPRRRDKNLETKISTVKKRLETDLWQLEELSSAKVAASPQPQPIVRKIVRKRAPKKLKA